METPLDAVNRLVGAINAGDVKTAVGLYEPEAVLVVRPGQVARGSAQLHEALAGFVALRAGDGRWLIVVDDPWGTQVLAPT